jgi:predicted Holliday junction resolvase-like endonuclease
MRIILLISCLVLAILVHNNGLLASPLRLKINNTYDQMQETLNKEKRNEDLRELYLKSRKSFEIFLENLRKDEMKKLEEEQKMRQIIKSYLGVRIGAKSILYDFYPRYY